MCTSADVRGQQKAAMSLQKSFPRRQYTLWTIVSCYLLAISDVVTTEERALFSTLASRLIPLVEPARTAEEAVLKARVLELLPTADQLISFLCDPATEKWNNLELATMRLDALVKSGNWEKVFDTSMTTLATENRDDFESWKQMAYAATKLGNDERTSALIELLEKRCKTRNGALAGVYYASLKSTEATFNAAKFYFENFGRQQCAFDDLKSYVEALDAQKWLAFVDEQITFAKSMEHATQNEVHILVNARKFHYLLDPDDKSFVDKNILLYNKLLTSLAFQDKLETDYFYGDDLIIMAATWLLQGRPVSSPVPDQDLVILVIILLETAASNDKHQFRVRLWLTRLYLYIGSFQQALGHYNALAIKNIQMDVLSHYLLSRVSTICPTWKPLISTRDIYDSNAVQTPYHIKKIYESGAFSQVAGCMEFGKRLSDSVNKGILCVEAKRVARILGMKMEGLGINPILRSTKWKENRDFSILYGSTPEETLENKYRIGPIQTGVWVNALILRETIIDEFLTADKRREYALALKELLEKQDLQSLTHVEKWSLETLLELSSIADSATVDGVAVFQTTLIEGMEKYAKLEETSLSWEWFHSLYIVVETAMISIWSLDSLVAIWGTKKNGKVVASIAACKKAVQTVVDDIKEDAKKLKLRRDKWVRDCVKRISELDILKKLDTSSIDIEYLIERIGRGQDESLTILRNTKI
ncbi:N-acetyltransferase B complex non catalytic subunit-domain-containing protein [Lipomyces kononenkoae]|uniref:N-acetyltransferase B complex non catalytic subunit-domain-containing protein n=1 Tax=Lipomyces kononenkoae TaxID=34357 RepID=A0ACC3SYV7_LIPKO